MNRRNMLLASLASSAGLALPDSLYAALVPPGGSPASLKSLAAPAGILLGVQAQKRDLLTPPFAQFVTENFSLITPGNELKWPRLHPTPDTYTFEDGDWMVNFCETHGLKVHGHNLCWNSPSGNPAWFPSVVNQQNARGILTDYITTVVKHYRGRIESWDVVNEPVVGWSKRPDGYYPGIWLGFIGNDYFDVAFHATQAADPGALRVLNCYNVEQDVPEVERTRQQTLTLLQTLLKRGVPVQAVGIESHLIASGPPVGPGYVTFLKKVRDLGLQVLITELDIDDSPVAGDRPTRDNVVGQLYYDYITTTVPAGKVNRLIFWTPSDRWDWLDSMKPDKYHRGDNDKHRPGLLNDALQPKAQYDAVAQALQKLSGSRAASSRWSGIS